MTDYSDLVMRLRGKKLNCICAAKSASECCCDTDWPESSCNEAADAIELLQRELKCATELWEQQKELALEYLADIVKANERIAELEAALKPFALGETAIEAGHNAASDDYPLMQVVSCGDLRQARKALENDAAAWEASRRDLGEKESA